MVVPGAEVALTVLPSSSHMHLGLGVRRCQVAEVASKPLDEGRERLYQEQWGRMQEQVCVHGCLCHRCNRRHW